MKFCGPRRIFFYTVHVLTLTMSSSKGQAFPLEDLSFGGLCRKLDKARSLATSVPPSQRKKELHKIIFNKNVTEARGRGDDIYPYIRLLLPVSDQRDRRKYGIKAQKLSTIFIKALKITETSAHGQLLKNWKGGAVAGISNAIEADIANKVRDVVALRATMYPVGMAAEKEALDKALASGMSREKAKQIALDAAADSQGKWSLRDANDWLDKVAGAYAGGMAAAETREAESGVAPGAASLPRDRETTGMGIGPYSAKRFLDDSHYIDIFLDMLRNCGPREVGWLASIILLDLRLGLKSSDVLKWYHPDANEHFAVNSSLRTVLSAPELKDPLIRRKASIKLGVAFDPMRADRLNFAKPQVLNKDFVIEQKLDGERLLLHFRRRNVGEELGVELTAWSRNKLRKIRYADVLREHFLRAVAPDVSELILDGELVPWDKESGTALPLHNNRRFAKGEREGKRADGPAGGHDDGEEDVDEEDEGDGNDALLRELPGDNLMSRSIHYFAFDCLWLTRYSGVATDDGCGGVFPDGDISHFPLRQRKLALAAAVPVDVLGHFKRLAPIDTCVGLAAEAAKCRIEEALLGSHKRLEEGIVIKELSRSYDFHRSTAQLKLKPEYVTGANENLDVVVVGGYCVEGASWRTTTVAAAKLKLNKTLIWVFLCALPRWSSPRARDQGEDPICFAPLCVVSSGVRPRNAEFLVNTMGPHWIPAPAKGPMPDWLCGWLPSSTLRPNYLIDPKNSVVIELKGTELIESSDIIASARCARKKCSVPVTVRFPRIASFRTDKSFRDADTEDQLSVIWNHRGGKMVSKALFESGGARKRAVGRQSGPPGKRVKVQGVSASSAVLSISVRDNVFGNEKVVVLPHEPSEYADWAARHFENIADRRNWGSRAYLIEIVKGLGGHFIQTTSGNEAENVIFIGVGDLKKAALGSRITSIVPPGANIYSPAWLCDAWISRKRPTIVRPVHFVRASPAMSEQLKRIVDSWGDEHASKPLDPAGVRSLLLRAMDARATSTDVAIAETAAAVASHSLMAPHILFRSVCFGEKTAPRARPTTAFFPAIQMLDRPSTLACDLDARSVGLEAWKAATVWRDYGGRIAPSLGADVDVVFVDTKRLDALPSGFSGSLTVPCLDLEWIKEKVYAAAVPR
jgi:ATP-dependent DNA ligase